MLVSNVLIVVSVNDCWLKVLRSAFKVLLLQLWTSATFNFELSGLWNVSSFERLSMCPPICVSWILNILFPHTNFYLHAASLSKQSAHHWVLVMCRCGFNSPEWRHFFHLKSTAELLIQRLTACAGCHWASHLFRSRFVYFDIIQNGLHLQWQSWQFVWINYWL